MIAVLLCTIVFSVLSPLTGTEELIFVNSDIREVQDQAWAQDLVPVLIESDCFLALAGGETPYTEEISVIASAPVDLDQYRIIYPAQVDGELDHLPGEIVFTSGRFLVLKLDSPCESSVFLPGAGFLRPLRIHLGGIRSSGYSYPPMNGIVDQIAGDVSEDTLKSYISHFESYGTRYTTYPQYDASADWADTMMQSYGLETEQQRFYFQSDSMSNVIGEIQGIQHPDRIFIICGHLDSISDNPPVAPGADDNASGSACVMEAARVMAPYQFKNTVRFVLFAAEEQWMVGSEYYVEQAYQQGDSILGAINVDMLLFAPSINDSVYIPYNDQSQEVAFLAGDIFAEYAPGIYPRVTYDPGAPSDHASFWQYGYTAIEIAEASCEEIWGGYNPHYHQSTDLLSSYLSSYPYGTQLSAAAIALLATLAEPLNSSAEEGTGNVNTFRAGANPCSGVMTVIGFPGEDQSFQVFNIAGREVSNGVLTSQGEHHIDLQALPGGMYTVCFPGLQDQPPIRFVLLN